MNTQKGFTLQRLFLAVCVAAAANLGLVPESRATTFTWDGGAGAPGNWTNALNWSSDTAPAVGTSVLLFTGSTQTSTTNDFAAGTIFSGIAFDNNATGGSFTLAGNSMTLGGDIVFTGAVGTPTHTISFDLILNGNRTISPIVGNNVTISGNISESGAGRTLNKGNVGMLTLTGNNSFTGSFWARGGLTRINTLADAGANSSLGAGDLIQLGITGNTATLDYTGGAASTNRQVQIGTNQAGIASTGGAVINNNGTGEVVFTGPNFNAVETSATNYRTLTVGGANNGAIQGVIANNSAAALVGVTKAGTGTWTLSGSNTYTGVTTVSAGTLLINGDQSTAIGGVNVSSNATLGGSNGIIGGAATVANLGILAPGTTPGSTATLTLNSKNLTISGVDSKVNIDIAGNAAGTFDQIAGVNAFTQNGDITFTLSGLYTDASWDIFGFASKTGDFDSITLAGSYTGTLTRIGDIWSAENIGGSSWEFNQATGVFTVVPEPATWAFVISGVAMTAALGRRRRSNLLGLQRSISSAVKFARN